MDDRRCRLCFYRYFDEIDTGVSGEVAAKVARLLRQMSEKVQVISITHLPQIASKADAHFFVFKEDAKERSYTNMRLLSQDERYEESRQNAKQ